MNVSGCSTFSGPNCTFGFDYWTAECLQLLPSIVRGDNEWAECVLAAATPFEQAIFAQWQYILTLWPAFIGFICSLGPDPADIVFDNVWWAALFAVTCGGLPGLDSRKPRHHATTDWASKGREMCTSHPETVVGGDSLTIPRSSARLKPKHLRAIVRMEWLGYSVSLICWAAFNVMFFEALRQSCVFSLKVSVEAGYWYWISAGPAVLSVLSEAFQNRVELYEPWGDTSVPAAVAFVTNRSLIRTATDSSIVETQQPQSADSKGQITRRAEAVTSPTTTETFNLEPFYQRSHSRSFWSVWLRIVVLQYQRKRYRVFVKPEDDRWFFMLWKLVVNLVRVAIFASGSTTMGGILLMSLKSSETLLVLLLFLTAIPRILFFNVWRNKVRGADLVVICNEPALDQDESSTGRAPEAGPIRQV